MNSKRNRGIWLSFSLTITALFVVLPIRAQLYWGTETKPNELYVDYITGDDTHFRSVDSIKYRGTKPPIKRDGPITVLSSPFHFVDFLWEDLMEDKSAKVYFTQDISPKGVKKIYKQMAPLFDGTPLVHEYKHRGFRNQTSDIMEKIQLPDSFANAISPNRMWFSNQLFHVVQTGQDEKQLGYTRYYEPAECFCYWEDYEKEYGERIARYKQDKSPESQQALKKVQEELKETRQFCQKLPKEEPEDCVSLKKDFEQYDKDIQTPKTVVVLSRAQINAMPDWTKEESGTLLLLEPGFVSGALKNMMNNSDVFSVAPPSIVGNSFSPLFESWVRRILNPKKRTFFITVLSDIPDKQGNRVDIGIVGSESFIAHQMAIGELVGAINNEVVGPAQYLSFSNEIGEVNLLNDEVWQSEVLTRNAAIKISDSVYDLFPQKSSAFRQKKATRLLEQRINANYEIVSLDK